MSKGYRDFYLLLAIVSLLLKTCDCGTVHIAAELHVAHRTAHNVIAWAAVPLAYWQVYNGEVKAGNELLAHRYNLDKTHERYDRLRCLHLGRGMVVITTDYDTGELKDTLMCQCEADATAMRILLGLPNYLQIALTPDAADILSDVVAISANFLLQTCRARPLGLIFYGRTMYSNDKLSPQHFIRAIPWLKFYNVIMRSEEEAPGQVWIAHRLQQTRRNIAFVTATMLINMTEDGRAALSLELVQNAQKLRVGRDQLLEYHCPDLGHLVRLLSSGADLSTQAEVSIWSARNGQNCVQLRHMRGNSSLLDYTAERDADYIALAELVCKCDAGDSGNVCVGHTALTTL